MSSDSFQVGDVVLVREPPNSDSEGVASNNVEETEPATVLKLGCAVDGREDGIMVRLKISNVCAVYTPDLMSKAFDEAEDQGGNRRRSSSRRRSQPNRWGVGSASTENAANKVKKQEESEEENKGSSKDADSVPEPAPPKPKNSVRVGGKKHANAQESPAVSVGEDDMDIEEEDVIPPSDSILRIENSTSSTAKCRACSQKIPKGSLRLEQIKGKGWRHYDCVDKKEIGDPCLLQGFYELSHSDQDLLMGLDRDDMDTNLSASARKSGNNKATRKSKGTPSSTTDTKEIDEKPLALAVVISKDSSDSDSPEGTPKTSRNKSRVALKTSRSALIEIDSDNNDEEEGDDDDNAENDDDDDELLKDLKKSKKKASIKVKQAKSKLSAKHAKKEEKPKAVKKAKIVNEGATSSKDGSKSGKSTKKKPRVKEELSEKDQERLVLAAAYDSDDGRDRPFRVEYAGTGRATCKTCDMIIKKLEIRVSHRPLFRGKPGFMIYRHLGCAMFNENITKMEQVGGWRRLSEEDRNALADRVVESQRLLEKENEDIHPDELVQKAFQGEMRGTPPGMAANLLPFQVEGVSWMRNQEVNTDIRSGILADEMGMGKTCQTIGTILDNRPKLQHSAPGTKHPPSSSDIQERIREEALWKEALDDYHEEMKMANVPQKLLPKKTKDDGGGGARAGTLVICPVIALYQWRDEIAKFTEENALSVCIYHGPDRASKLPRKVLTKYDVVLTTYQVIESDYRKMVSPNKVKCPNCGGSFKIDKLKVHLTYFCGAAAKKTEAQARQRRAGDRPESNPRRGGKSGGSGKKEFSTSKKRVESKAAPPKPKKVIRIRKSSGYDSDSDLSVPDDVAAMNKSGRRPSRSAAKTASRRLSDSAKRNADEDAEEVSDSDSEGFKTSDEQPSSDDESSVGARQKQAKTTKSTSEKNAKESSKRGSEDSDGSSDDDSEVAENVRKKQRLALERAISKAKGKEKKKKVVSKKAKKPQKKAPTAAGRKRKKGDDSSDESDDSSVDSDRDPMEGIDMDELMNEAMEGSRASVLHTLSWWRVVLDEAHMIKSRSSQTSAAAFSLTAIHRWCLSGTPLQNRVGEMYSLIRFLRIKPMCQYFCRKNGCDCSSIHYRMLNGRCQDCGHGSVQHFSYFNKHVLNPIQRGGYQGDGRRAMLRLKDEVLDTALLRRTKQTRAEDMNLPPRVVKIRTIRLHPVESDFYQALYTQTRSSFDDYVQEGTLLNNYAHIFDLLTKMRQAVDHPYLIVHSKKNSALLASNGPAIANGSIDCDLCNDPPIDRVVSSCCGAAFCRSCVVDFMSPTLEGANVDNTRCPSCRNPFSIDLSQKASDVVDEGTLAVPDSKTSNPSESMPSLKEMPHVATGSILRRIDLAEFATSTKVEALVQELVQMRRERPGSKALVFSQFVNMLDLIRWRIHSDPCLQDLGLGVRIIHGGMNVKSRDECLKDFREDCNVRVLLMSLKAGGVALNLTVANEAYLMDPWWNPAAEMQAIDRTHRLGQYRPIRAVRFIAEDTVEERVLQLQAKKQLVFNGTVGRDAASLKMLTVDDMKALFT